MSDTLTVEEALKSLREMFPERWRLISIEVVDKPTVGQRKYFIRIQGKPQFLPRPTLDEVMQKVRTWHAEQKKEK